jgi:hypothetical protein
MTPEPFVSAETAAQFSSISRRHLLALARQGIAGAYSLGKGNQAHVMGLSPHRTFGRSRKPK